LGLVAAPIKNLISTAPLPLTASRLIDIFAGPSVSSGVTVTPESSLTLSVVYACVRILSETLAGFPFQVFERLPEGGRQKAEDHPLYRLLHEEPNPWMTSFQLRETLMGHLALRGNAFAEIERDGRGVPINLWPLRPDRMQQISVSGAGTLLYTYTLPNGEPQTLPQRSMLHLRGLSSDGINGYSPITLQREGIGLALAAQEFGGRFFGQGARPGGLLKVKQKLSKEAAERLAQSFASVHQGLANSHRLAVLEEGVEWQSVGMTQADAQYMLTRQFQVREVARMFRIPPHKVGDLDQATFSNIQIQGVEFVTDTMRPWVIRWEQQITKDLFLAAERKRYFAEMNMDAIQRGDIGTRFDAYGKARQWGFFNVDEIREKENMNPLPDGLGQEFLTPVNMVPAGTDPAANTPTAAAA
jgi:HK97 family phage portal protein